MMANTNGHANSGNASIGRTKMTLYTNHNCPYAHRAHIALKELDLPFDEVLIDLNTPREPWYLKINPRGLVPSLKWNDSIITESQIITQFLADANESHLTPSSQSDPLFRARLNFFIDTWNSKIASFMIPAFRADTLAEKEKICKGWVAAIEKHIEPLLEDAGPFFGGRKELTLAEVHAAPFLLRYYAMANDELLPVSFKASMDSLTNFGPWAKATMAKESARCIWDEDRVVAQTVKTVAKLKAKTK